MTGYFINPVLVTLSFILFICIVAISYSGTDMGNIFNDNKKWTVSKKFDFFQALCIFIVSCVLAFCTFIALLTECLGVV